VSGTVYAPNGTLPLYNVILYVPNAELATVPQGVQCDQCGSVASGSPLVTALSDATGKFVLRNVPVGQNIPLVTQLGKWRRKTTLPVVKPCVDNPLTDPNLTRLPKNQTEGNMPHIALTSGSCDSMGCMLPKIGIDPNEFGYQADGYAKAVNVYWGGDTGTSPLPNATPAMNLWGDATQLKTYDMSIFSCECQESAATKGTYGSPSFQAVTSYLDAGGRIFTTDYQYTWYRYSPDPNLGLTMPGGIPPTDLLDTGIGQINGGAPEGVNPIVLDTSFPKGLALAQWLQMVFPTSPYGQVKLDVVFDNITSLNMKPQVWANSAAILNRPPGTRPRVFTVNAPVGQPVAQQCGKGVHIDAHINVGGVGNDVACDSPGTCYPYTCTQPLKQDEAMFAFFFFDLASCIQEESQPPVPPAPK